MYSKETRIRFGKDVRVDHESGCWVWVGPCHPRGYGMFYAGVRNIYAHRYLYEYVNGPVPVGLELDHLCCIKACVRRTNLEAVTHAENMRRAALAGAWSGERNPNAKRTHQEVIKIRALCRMGMPVAEISTMLDMPERSVYYAINEGWSHLEP